VRSRVELRPRPGPQRTATGRDGRHRPLRLGTRGSPLALAQADRIARQLRERCGRTAVLVTVATPGDESTAPIEGLGPTGVFTTTLREALLRGVVDLVVHSAKDLPTAPVPGLQVAAFPAREDPRDALIWPGGTSLDALPHGARIGTGSPRRAALLRATGRQLQIVPMRGNVGTRLRKLADGEADALILAMAGLSRLGLLDAVATPLDPTLLMPAPAQGVLAVECRTDDPVTAAQLRTLDHAPTRAAAITERGFLAALHAGCSAPVGALAEPAAEAGAAPAAVRLSGLIAAPDGSSVIRAQTTGVISDGDALGRRLAHILLHGGGAALLNHTPNGLTDPPRAQAHPWTSSSRSPTDRGFAGRGRIPASCNVAAPHPCQHDRMPLRCLLVDDNDAFLEAASGLLQREGVTVVGVASNTAEALRQARALRPDVILVDIGLGDESGFDLARLLARDGQGAAEVIMISARPETDYTELIAESPAAGFLAKSELSARGIGRLLGHTP
jgi:hydroxymethylbilane synthase